MDLSGKDTVPPGTVFSVGKLVVSKICLLTEGDKPRSRTKQMIKEDFPGEMVKISSADLLKKPLDSHKAQITVDGVGRRRVDKGFCENLPTYLGFTSHLGQRSEREIVGLPSGEARTVAKELSESDFLFVLRYSGGAKKFCQGIVQPNHALADET